MGSTSRPRVGAHREREIFDMVLDLVTDIGYDRLTMDAVARSTRSSKATLYRRWPSKRELVAEAVLSLRADTAQPAPLPDAGDLRQDVLAVLGEGDLLREVRLLCGVATAAFCDQDLRDHVVTQLAGPRLARLEAVLARAGRRGEVPAGADLALLSRTVPALAVLEMLCPGPQQAPPDLVAGVVDGVILPALGAGEPA